MLGAQAAADAVGLALCVDVAVIDPDSGVVVDSERFSAGQPSQLAQVAAYWQANWGGGSCQRLNAVQSAWIIDAASPALRAPG